MNLIIAGDVVANSSNENLFARKELNKILGEQLNKIWNEANYKIFNLEAPITDSENKIKKSGPNLKNNPQIIDGIKSMHPSCVLLSNNHIMDYSNQGLKDTINILNEINWIGVGNDKENLNKSIVFENNVGIYNCCETEFSNVTENKAGANYYDEFEIEKDIVELKKKCKYLVVIYHGGKEYYRYPSPFLQKRCRELVDYGADLIVCQHSHCIGCKEEYKKGTIIYGQGNFIFNQNSNEYWDTSLLIDLEMSDYSINYIPIVRTNFGTRMANENEKRNILNDFSKRSEEIRKDKFILTNYDDFAKKKFDEYLAVLHGNNMLFRIINKIFKHKFVRIFYNEKNLLTILNFIECEAHRELLIQGLKNKIYNER